MPIPYAAALYLALIQFLFATTWTVYVSFLPELFKSAGLKSEWIVWVILLDQILFTFTDTAMGYAADRVERLLGQLGYLIAAVSILSCLAFLLLPFVVNLHVGEQSIGGFVLLGLIIIWVITSSVLRAPPLVLLTKYAAKSQIPWLSTLSMLGLALAGSFAPYLGLVMKGVDPRIPFVVSSLTLLATVLGLVWVERYLQPSVDTKSTPSASSVPVPIDVVYLLLSGTLFVGMGFQIYYFLSTKPLIAKFLSPTPENMAILLPIFWIGFKLLMLPATAIAKRVGSLSVMVGASALGILGIIASLLAPNIDVLMTAQFVTGGAWGCLFVSGISSALGLGKTGREGLILGLWFSVLSFTSFMRVGITATQLPSNPVVSTWLPFVTVSLWGVGMVILVVAALRYQQQRVDEQLPTK